MNASSASSASPAESRPPLPWWRHGMVWMVIGGPAVVVVASIATLVLAVRMPDPVLAEDAYRKGVQVDQRVAPDKDPARALMPAQQGSYHALSPSPPTAPADLR